MINNIVDIDNINDFDFNKIKLGKPIVLQGQTFFSKLLNEQNELIVQTPKGLLKNGFVTSGKKTYCDFMISKINQESLEWFEKLEEHIQNSIYEKRNDWFHGEVLEKDDIEDMYNSCLKSYKSGKFFTIRLYTESPRNVVRKTQSLNIFDDNGNALEYKDITENSELICLFHIHGIKFSTKNFQLYIEAKQLLVMNEDNNIFNKPIINKYRNNEKKTEEIEDKSEKENVEENKTEMQNNNQEEDRNKNTEENLKEHEENINESNENIIIMKDNKTEKESNNEMINKEERKIEENEKLSEEVNIATNEKEKIDELVEYVPTINEDIEVVELEKLKMENKQRHYEEYIAARNKAKEARKETLKLIAEARKIKNIYMLEDLDDNDESEEEYYSADEYSENEYSENEDT